MAYSVLTPPVKLVSPMAGAPGIWSYSSTDAVATVRGANYFTNALDLGMKPGDAVWSFNSSGNLGSWSVVQTVTAAGATMAATT